MALLPPLLLSPPLLLLLLLVVVVVLLAASCCCCCCCWRLVCLAVFRSLRTVPFCRAKVCSGTAGAAAGEAWDGGSSGLWIGEALTMLHCSCDVQSVVLEVPLYEELQYCLN